jgi:thioredoxin-related protein
MRKGVLSQQVVQDWYRDRFVSIAIDIHGDVDITDFDGVTLPEKMIAEQRRVFLTPTVSFIDLDGAEVYRHVGLVKTVEEFLAMGEYVAGRHYFDKEFSGYASSRGVRMPADTLVTPAEVSSK